MIVRTYGRRNRCVNRSFSNSSFVGGIDESHSQESSQEIHGLNFSSQDSSPWSLDPDLECSGLFSTLPSDPKCLTGKNGCAVRNSKKPPKNPNSSSFKNLRTSSTPSTSTLMEAQEFGEMMEHVDEVNFALDGLRFGQPVRIRRASLLSLLSICATVQQRRLIRTQGMAKTIIDAILGLSIDDSPSNLAASALFYILASDGQDDHLLDSPSCVRFLLKFLNGPSLDNVEKKSLSIGSKLLTLNKDCSLKISTKRLDSSSMSVILKVQDILLNCKELKPGRRDEVVRRPELSPKWIALLTMEKACVSKLSIEDGSGSMRRVGGGFKESLRNHGGLDAIFDIIVNCHSIIEKHVKNTSPFSQELKKDIMMESLVLLLKCLKIMENATFLSTDNQNHLLGMNVTLDSAASNISFVGLILSAIKILSGLSLLQNSFIPQREDKSDCPVHEVDRHYGQNLSKVEEDVNKEKASHVKRRKGSKKCRKFPASQSGVPSSSCITTSKTSVPDHSTVTRVSSATMVAYSGTSSCSDRGKFQNCSKVDPVGLGKRSHMSGENVECSQDPFAFDENDTEPSTWEVVSTKNPQPQTDGSMKTDRECAKEPVCVLATGNCELIGEQNDTCENLLFVPEESNDLLDDCLITAVKVLMNLTNDNPIGCQQIASCGGLDILAALITCHFPFFNSLSYMDCQTLDSDSTNGRHFNDEELDFLVVILGLLVNLVEKDKQNRSRLAEATIPLPRSKEITMKQNQKGVVSLLCSIFLANQGDGEAVGDGKELALNDEVAMLQEEREAEKMIVEAYAALLLAFLSTESVNVREAIADCLPERKLEILIPVIERFVAFHRTLNMISPETHAAVCEVIESCRGT